MRNGDVVRMKSFTHVPAEGPLIELTIKVAGKNKVAVFLLLGEENKDGSEPLDLEGAINALGWYRREA